MIRGIFVLVVTFAYIFLVGPPFLIYALVTGRTDALYAVACWGAKMALWLSGARLVVRGLEKVPKKDVAVVFMPNHESYCDPPALISVLPPILALGNKELFRTPVLGKALLLRGFISVDRQNGVRAVRAVGEAVKSLMAGNSFLAFPEGRRTMDGRLQPFKKGVFIMAIKAGAPVVPVSISGSIKILRKGEWAMHPGTVRMTFHDPIPTKKFTLADREKLMELTRRAIISGLKAEEWPLEDVNGKNQV